MFDSAPRGSLDDHERKLRSSFDADAPERELADWTAANLAVVISQVRRKGLPAESQTALRHRALLLIGIRILRATRAGMAVLASGYELEARAINRLVLETWVRGTEIEQDSSGETARRWLKGERCGAIGQSIDASFPKIDSASMNRLYRALAQDARADPGGVFRALTEVDGRLTQIACGPHRTITTRRSLLMYALIGLETASLLAFEGDVEHPDRGALTRALTEATDTLARDAWIARST